MFEEINTKEELYDVLTAVYDVDEKTALIIIENLASRHRLSESEEILLLSHEIPQDFLEYIQNNKNLNQRVIEEGEEENISLVGPFFYINKKLYTHSVPLKDFKKNERFYNDPISHLEFFDTLCIEGDYGNYPRGRVIYDSLKDKYIVYMDKSIMTKDIKHSVMLAYCLDESKTVFRRDAHYTHDYL
jgi:hypothetical protein